MGVMTQRERNKSGYGGVDVSRHQESELYMSGSSGKGDEAKGRVKEAVGDLTDDDDLKREGKADRAAGSVKAKAEKAKDWVEDKAEDAKEWVEDKVDDAKKKDRG
jgi:uncharacterized protein YjbJ (UPF0337 family)